MGFSSYLCRQCGNPALCPSATINSNSWMSDVVLVPKEGATIEGTYDGYGGVVVDDRGTVERLPVRDCYGFTEGTLLHKACAEKRGAHYRGPSPNADCQGWFFNQGPGGPYDKPDPRGLAVSVPPEPDMWQFETPRILNLMVRFEADRLDRSETVELFQHLVDTRDMTAMHGIYGRTARQFMAWGTIKPKEEQQHS